MLKKLMLSAATVTLLSGCAGGYSPVTTGLVTDVKGPISATAIVGNKEGRACSKTVLGLVNDGDASIIAAKKAGGISAVSTVDFHTKGFYPFFGETCTIVTGK